jgi:tetratricopeptide (TPR) repeat protein
LKKLQTMTIQKKIVFTSFTILIPFLFFLILELFLRLVTPSLKNPIVQEVSYDKVDWYQINRGYLKKFFPVNSQLIPEFKPAIFRKEKLANTYRVICLGGSSMFGTPYQMTSTISGILRRQLRHLYPQLDIEVINFGASAINSQVIKQFTPELIQFKPDLVLIYMGHNEFYGPEGVGATWLEKKVPLILSLKHILRELRMYQIIRNWLTAGGPEKNQLLEKNLMLEVSQGSLIELDSDDSHRIFTLFRKNLTEIISCFQDKDIPLIVSDITSNLLFPPFAFSQHIQNHDLKKVIEQVEKSYQQQQFSSALELLQPLAKLDSTNAIIQFWIGRCFLGMGEIDQARHHLILARDYDLLKFRAPAEINRIIYEICSKKNIPLISAEKYIAALSSTGISGYQLFWEHLHLRDRGYYSIAELFLDKIIQLDLLPVKNDPGIFNRRLPFDYDLLSICWLDLAYADRSMINLTSSWPFNNFQINPQFLNEKDDALQKIVQEVYQKRMVWDEACYRTATVFEKKGDFRSAQTTYEAVIEEYPLNFYAHYQLARLFKDQGQLNEAIPHYQISIQSNPQYLFSRLESGMVEINSGQFDQAIENLEYALKLLSGNKNPAVEASIYYGLSAAYANKNELQKALRCANRAVNILPSYQPALEIRRRLLEAQSTADKP